MIIISEVVSFSVPSVSKRFLVLVGNKLLYNVLLHEHLHPTVLPYQFNFVHFVPPLTRAGKNIHCARSTHGFQFGSQFFEFLGSIWAKMGHK